MRTTVLCGSALDILKTLESNSVHCCVTSPPYWGLRDYGVEGQLGLEKTPNEFVEKLVAIFSEVRRVLMDDGTLWLNLGDSYASGKGTCYNPGGGEKSYIQEKERYPLDRGNISSLREVGLKPKDLVGIPWRVAFALQADGWYLRQDIIWHKPNPMPESVTDRCTKAHEYIFLLSKSARYYYDSDSICEPAKWERWGNQTENKKHSGTAGHLGNKSISELPIKNTKNARSVWTITTQPYKEAHFATFPEKIPELCIKAGCPEGGTVLDPFSGSGTTLAIAEKLGRSAIGIELNPEYITLIEKRIAKQRQPLFS